MHRLWRDRQARIGLMLLAALLLMALLAPWLRPGDPLDLVGAPLLSPFRDAALPLGTDRLGRDILAGLMHGARSSLMVALLTVLVAASLGVALGALAGTLGGWVDRLVMGLADALQTVPSFLLVLVVVSLAGPSLGGVVLALSLGAWTLPARVTRAEVLALREADFVAASRLIGRGRLAIAWQVILPNALTTASALVAIIAGQALLLEAALAFLGLGDPNRASWGAMIAEGRAVMRTHAFVLAIPGAALFMTVLAVALVGEGVERASTND